MRQPSSVNRIALACVLLSGVCGCTRPAEPPGGIPDSAAMAKLIAVKLQLNWFPEAEHGGYFAALAAGYYREAGLDVTILPGGPNAPVIQDVARGTAAFGVSNADNVLFARAQQAPVVAVMAPLQTSPRCLIVHEKAGIKGFDDLHDMTIAVTPGAAFVECMRLHVPLKGVKFVPYTSVESFLRQDDFAQQGYVFSEPYVAREKGGDPQVLLLADLGFNPYTSLLITSEIELRDRPDVVRRMVAASLRGWHEYVSNPGPANELIHEKNPAMDLPALEYGAKAIVPLVLGSRRDGIGMMVTERWLSLAQQLVESKQLQAGKVDPQAAFDTQFLPFVFAD